MSGRGSGSRSQVSARLVVLFAAFVLLGVPEGVLGTAWPSMRVDFARPESALAFLLIAYTLGYLIASALVGRLVDRLGSDGAIRAGLATTGVALALYATSPTWWLLGFAAFVLGSGGGVIDASINADVALNHGQRAMNLLHAAFGVGATLGPLLVTGLLAVEVSWRIGYVILLAAEIAVLVAFRSRTVAAPREAGAASATYAARVARPRLVLGATLVYFALYVGAEVSVGQWSYSVLTEQRDVSTTMAGIAVAAYWGGLTAGRLALGTIGDRLHPMALLRGAGLVAAGAVVWFALGGPGSIAALPLLGFAFAGIFPALVLMTSSWLPPDRVTAAVGWQLAASSAGAIGAAAALGAVAARLDLGATVWAMAALVVLMLGAHVVTERAAQTR